MKSTKKYGKEIDLALSMWVKLARAFSSFNKLTADDIRSYGLTQPQFGALECLGHLGPMTIGELCRKHLVSGGNMTVVVDNLEEMGLVERIPSEEDRRSILVRLTSKGKKLFNLIFIKHAQVVLRAASVLSEAEQEQLGALLKKLGAGIQKSS